MKLSEVLSRIQSASIRGGNAKPAQLVAVSKMQSIKKILSLYHEGQRAFGENYVQELLEKVEGFKVEGVMDIDFHFIGKLQSNKVKQLVPVVSTIHSVDSVRLLFEIEKRAEQFGKKVKVYFQINIDEEATKGGFEVNEMEALCESINHLKWTEPTGLMCIPDPNREVRFAFKKMLDLRQKFGAALGMGLSMGMSGDFEIAAEMGSTVVRVGSALFGPRGSV